LTYRPTDAILTKHNDTILKCIQGLFVHSKPKIPDYARFT